MQDSPAIGAQKQVRDVERALGLTSAARFWLPGLVPLGCSLCLAPSNGAILLASRMSRRPYSANGWPVFFLLAGVSLLVALVCLGGGGEVGVRSLVRVSARTSASYFAAAFMASSLVSLWRNGATLWLRRNRRYIGLAFAFAHTVHLGGLAALAIFYPDPFLRDLSALTLVGGGLAYIFVYALAFTSSDAAVRWLGPRNWHRLHWVGSWVIWVVFVQTLTPETFSAGVSRVLVVVALWTAAVLRVGTLRPRLARPSVGEVG